MLCDELDELVDVLDMVQYGNDDVIVLVWVRWFVDCWVESCGCMQFLYGVSSYVGGVDGVEGLSGNQGMLLEVLYELLQQICYVCEDVIFVVSVVVGQQCLFS